MLMIGAFSGMIGTSKYDWLKYGSNMLDMSHDGLGESGSLAAFRVMQR